MALVMRARLLISATVSTPVLTCAPTASLSSASSRGPMVAPKSVPIAVYCVAVGLCEGSASGAGPLASANMAL